MLHLSQKKKPKGIFTVLVTAMTVHVGKTAFVHFIPKKTIGLILGMNVMTLICFGIRMMIILIMTKL